MDRAAQNEFAQRVSELTEELAVPGVAAAVLADGEELYAFHGVTSVENPLPVDEKTFFQFGSTGKTYTATAVLRLVESGQVDLDAPVRRYLPDFRVADEDVASKVTVLQLLNHTAGWQGDLMDDTGPGDDALARYVARMQRLVQVTPLGGAASYNNASLSVAGRILEVVTGKTYEQAMRDLILNPLGLQETLFFPNDIMTRRFAVGHNRHEDGRITVARPWALPRGNAPAGGMSATAHDQMRWARFHLGDGRAADGSVVLSAELLKRMQVPTVEMKGSALGDYVGISWLIRDVDGVRLVAHGGTTNGQHSSFALVPERDFAFISLTNCGPNGPELNSRLEKWCLERFLGVRDVEPEALQLAEEALVAYTGRFETIAAVCDISVAGGGLLAKVEIKPEMAAMLRESGEEVPEEQPPIPLAITSLDGDRYVVPTGPGKGMRGYFTRDADGHVDGVHMGGRLATRVAAVPA